MTSFVARRPEMMAVASDEKPTYRYVMSYRITAAFSYGHRSESADTPTEAITKAQEFLDLHASSVVITTPKGVNLNPQEFRQALLAGRPV